MSKRDPHTDPLRAPSRRGQHPHAFPARMENKNPQVMYEHRDVMGEYGQAAPPPNQKSLLQHPLVMLGLGAIAAYALAKVLSDDEGEEKKVRSNPAPAPAPAPAQAPPVFVMPQSIPVQTAGAAMQLSSGVAAAAQVAPQKKKRVRHTRQGRTKTGQYTKASKRRKITVEGKE